jgi:hypothetical protein
MKIYTVYSVVDGRWEFQDDVQTIRYLLKVISHCEENHGKTRVYQNERCLVYETDVVNTLSPV